MKAPSAAGRLFQMSAREIYTRARQETAKRKDVLLYRFGMDPCPAAPAASQPRGRFYFDPEDTPRIIELLRSRLPGCVESNVANAERILNRRFDLLGYRDLDFGRDIDWSLDPVHGKHAPALLWPSIRFLDFDEVGDHKIIWELNRLQFLVTLAKAYRITGDARFADGLREIWQDWRRKNPYPVGINWASALEVAFRTLSLMWTASLLEGSAADSEALQRGFASAIACGGWYIHRFLSTYFSPNTHLLGEGAALFLIGARYPDLPGASAWSETGWRIVCEEASRQVRPDGLYFEQSTYYHVYALDFFLHARLLASRSGVAIPKPLDETVRGMAAALAQLSSAGALPRFGDDDGGRLFDPSRNRPEHMLDPLSTAAVLFRDPALKAAAPGLCEETLWLAGPQAAASFDAVPSGAGLPACPAKKAFPDSGIYAMTAPGPPKAQLFIDAGDVGSLAAGHGHADTLSIQLAANNHLWLTDPGACAYLGDARTRFRGTSAHNTMAVDGLHQADPAGLFSWGPLPRVQVRRWFSGEGFDLLEAFHNGYERLPDPVTHRRWVLRWGADFWLVRDVAEGRGAHRFEISWHFAPEAAVEAHESAVISTLEGESLVIAPCDAPGWKRSIEPDEYSPAYGARIPSQTARWAAKAECPVEFAAVIRLGAAEARLALVATGAAGAIAYEYGGRRLFFAQRKGEAWRSGEWASDAALLGIQAGELFMADGSYVDYAGKRLVTCGQTVLGLECRRRSGRWSASIPNALLTPESLPTELK